MSGHLCLGFGSLGDLTGCTTEFLCLLIQRKEAIIDIPTREHTLYIHNPVMMI